MKENDKNAQGSVHHLNLTKPQGPAIGPVQAIITMNPDGMIKIDTTQGISHQQLFTMIFVFDDFVRCAWKGQL